MIFVTVSACSLLIYLTIPIHCLLIFMMTLLCIASWYFWWRSYTLPLIFLWWSIYTLVYDLCLHKKEIFSIHNRTWVRVLYTLRSNRQQSFRHYIALGMQLFIANTTKMKTFKILNFGDQIFICMEDISLLPSLLHILRISRTLWETLHLIKESSCVRISWNTRNLLLVEISSPF